VGLNGCGKTTILYRLQLGRVVDTTPTMGAITETVAHNGVHVTEVSGGEKWWPMLRQHLVGLGGLVFVVDAADGDWLVHARDLLFKELLAREDFRGLPLLVYVNKQDKAGAVSAPRLAAALGLDGPPVEGVPQIYIERERERGGRERERLMSMRIALSPRRVRVVGGPR
jgi:signal recognition particle receptor subunit beta